LHVLVKREGIHANHKRVHSIYREAGLACDAVAGATA
jgi:putative transposase